MRIRMPELFGAWRSMPCPAQQSQSLGGSPGTRYRNAGMSTKFLGWLKTTYFWYTKIKYISFPNYREACGGHGYLKSAGLSRLRDDNDAFLTFEGENNVLMQQTSNWLINLWNEPNREISIKQSKMNSLTFLSKADQRLRKKFRKTDVQTLTSNPKIILEIYKWLICYKLRLSSEKYNDLLFESGGEDTFTAKNQSQVFFARTLSLAFIEHVMLEKFYTELCSRDGLPNEIRTVLHKLMILFGLWSLERQHLGTLFEGGYFSGCKPTKLIREGILQLCESLKPEVVTLADVIAPPDFVLNSVLGASDGLVYKRLEQAMSQYPDSFSKSSKWTDYVGNLKSKL